MNKIAKLLFMVSFIGINSYGAGVSMYIDHNDDKDLAFLRQVVAPATFCMSIMTVYGKDDNFEFGKLVVSCDESLAHRFYLDRHYVVTQAFGVKEIISSSDGKLRVTNCQSSTLGLTCYYVRDGQVQK